MKKLKPIERPRLTSRFMDGLNRKLTFVEAPLGYGKTTLIRSWVSELEASQISCQYVSLENFQTGQLRRISHALTKLMLEQSVNPGSINLNQELDDIFAQRLSNDLERLKNKCCLIVDDFHTIDPAGQNFIQILIRAETNNLHLVIGSRDSPSLPLNKLRLANQVNDFSLSDLRFSEEEASLLFQGKLPQSHIKTYLDRTEGWIAALHLLRQSGELNPNFSSTFDQVSDFASYLNEQYFARLEEDNQDLLMHIAHVSRVDGDLANYLTGRDDCWTRLEELATYQALIFQEVEDERTTFRFHQLLRDFLRGRQERLGKEKLIELFRRTAQWFDQNDDLFHAMHHACAAGDEEWAAKMLLKNGGIQYGMLNGAARLASCADLLSVKWIYKEPRLLLTRAYLFLKAGRIKDATELLSNIRELSEPNNLELERELILVESHVMFYNDIPNSGRQLEALEHTIKATPMTDPLTKGLLNNFLCVFLMEEAEFDKAHLIGENAMSLYQDLNAIYLQFFMHAHLSSLELETGNAQKCASQRQIASDISKKIFSFDSSLKAIADIYQSEINFERGNMTDLTETLLRSISGVDRQEGWNMLYLAGYETCLNQLVAENKIDEAVDLLEHAGHFVARRELRFLGHQTRIMELELAIRLGAKQEAKRLAENIQKLLDNQTPEDKLRWSARIRAFLTLSKYEKSYGSTNRAMQWIDTALTECDRRSFKRLKLRALVAKFLLHTQLLDSAAAQYHLKEFIIEAQNHKSYGAALRERDAFTEAALWLVAQNGLAAFDQNELRFLAQCIWLIKGYSTIEGANIFSQLLTEKEYHVLTELAKGQANKVIARQLDITEPTVKFHLKNIYKKLGVNSRKLAIEMAKQYGPAPTEAPQ